MTAIPNPLRLSETITAEVDAGQTVAEILGRTDLPAVAHVDGVLIEADQWHVVRPQQTLTVAYVPQGGDALRIVASLAVVAFAAWAAPGLSAWAGITSDVGIATVTAGLSLAGSLAVNALIPPQMPSIGGDGQPESLAQISGQTNQPKPFAPIPRVYGQCKFYPPIPMTALPYTELVGQDQYLRMMLCLGYGPLDVGGTQVGGAGDALLTDADTITGDPIKIGDTSITAFDDVEWEIGRPDQITLYTDQIVEQTVNVSLPISNPDPANGRDVTIIDGQQVTRTTEADSEAASLDLVIPSLFSIDSRGRSKWAKVTFRVEYSPAGAGTWTLAPGGLFTISSKDRDPTRRGFSVRFPSSGQYDVRLTRVQTFLQRAGGDNQFASDASWTVLRSIKSGGQPFSVDNTVVMALRIRATDQIGTRLDRLSVEATSVLKTWNGSAWVDAVTRNPAWAYVDIATGNATREPVALSSVNATALKDFADWCDSNDLYFDHVVTSEGTVFDRLREAAAAGFGAWSVEDDARISIVRDVPNQVPRMQISPRTVSGFSVEHNYPRLPHGLRVQYTDADTLERSEIIVFDDGYSESNATRFEQLQTTGVRTTDHAWKFGRYHLAQLRLRPEQFGWRQDIGHLVYQRGDAVEISHDIILVALAYGRIKSVTTDTNGDATEVEVDELLEMETGTSYALRIQRRDGTFVTAAIDTVSPGTNTATFATPVADVQSGDTFVHGEAGAESLPARVTGVNPVGSLRARITAVPAADAIFDAWDGTIPPYDPVITEPVDEALRPPPIPVIGDIKSGTNAAYQATDGSEANRLVVAFQMPPGLSGVTVEGRTRIRETVDGEDTIGPWRYPDPVSSSAQSIEVRGVEPDQAREIQLRSRRGDRVSDWSVVATATVVDGQVYGRVGGQNLLSYTAATAFTDDSDDYTVRSETYQIADLGVRVGELLSFSVPAEKLSGSATRNPRATLIYRDSGGSSVEQFDGPGITDGASEIEGAEVPDTATQVEVRWFRGGTPSTDTSEIAFGNAMLNMGPKALPFEWPPTRVNRGEVEEGAEVNAAGSLVLEINVDVDGDANSGEGALYGVTSGVPDRSKDGYINWNGSKITIDRVQTVGTRSYTFVTEQAADGFIAFDTSKSNPFVLNGTLGNVDVAFVRKNGSQWQYDDSGSWQDFTPTASMVALGWLSTGSDVINEGGLFGQPIQLTLAALPRATEGATIGDNLLQDDGSTLVTMADFLARFNKMTPQNIQDFLEQAAVGSDYIESLVADKILAGNITVALNLSTGNLEVSNTGKIFSGKTNFNTASDGFFLGRDSGVPKFRIGNSDNTQSLTWDGDNLVVEGGFIRQAVECFIYDESVSDSEQNTDSGSYFQVGSDRKVRVATGSFPSFSGGGLYEWIKGTNAISDYQVRADVVSGNANWSGTGSSPVNQWLSMSQARAWGVVASWSGGTPSNPNVEQVELDVSVRHGPTGFVFSTSRVSLYADAYELNT